MPDYDAVLFDNDGVLVHPPAAATQKAAIREAFRSVGVDDPAERYVEALCSGVTPDVLDEIGEAYDVDPETLWLARERHDERSQIAAFRAGHRDRYDDVEAIVDHHLPSGVVSNNHHTTVEFLVEHFGWHGTFDTYYGREMSVESLRLKKPNTHYLERALTDLDASSALYVGDSETDVVAADRAGLDSALVRREHATDVYTPVAPTHEVVDLHEVAALLAD